MMNERVEQALNDQIEKEAASSQLYLAMASWSEGQGLSGTSQFLYSHSTPRNHLLEIPPEGSQLHLY